MATLRQYATRMRATQNKVAVKLGSDLSTAPKELRVAVTSVLVVVAVLVKAIVDKGVLTDAELQTALTAAEDDLYDDEPRNP